jgi:hypothetical protein
MIPNEVIYGLIGAAAALLGGRLGLPLLSAKTPSPTDLGGIVRQVLLDVLKGVSQPTATPDDEIRKHLQALSSAKKDG